MSKPFIAILRIFITAVLLLAIVIFFTLLIRHRIDNLHKDKIPSKEKQTIEPPAEYKLQVKEIQQILKSAGFDPGPIDGVMGNRTRQAIREFQQSKGLTADGIVGPKTREELSKPH